LKYRQDVSRLRFTQQPAPEFRGALSTLKPFQLVQRPCKRSNILKLAAVEMN
jgi:hypothetical protein